MNAAVESVRGRVSADEWQVRVDLAACYRLVALNGWDDLVFTHITAQVTRGLGGQLAWPGLLRKLDRIDQTFRD